MAFQHWKLIPFHQAQRPLSALGRLVALPCLALGALVAVLPATLLASPHREAYYQEEIMPLLLDSCYDCHDYESKKGGFSIDDFDTFTLVSKNKAHWYKVFKNLQSHVMPPPEKAPPSIEDRHKMLSWIKRDVFEINPDLIDPGRVAPRRLNRIEYENTLFDLTGVRISADDILPADDTGYGFDNIADALSISPLHLEKYIRIANDIVEAAIPEHPYTLPQRRLQETDFTYENGESVIGPMKFSEAHRIEAKFQAKDSGTYRIKAVIDTPSFFNFDYGESKLDSYVNGALKSTQILKHLYKEDTIIEFEMPLAPGSQFIRFELTPHYDYNAIESEMTARVDQVTIEGPLDDRYLRLKPEYAKFFPNGPPPEDLEQWEPYARDVLRRFAYNAYRRPPSESDVDRLIAFARTMMKLEDLNLEEGITRAFAAILSSPKFLYRIEPMETDDPSPYPLIDEFALATRLSYFFWSSTPDKELLDLAADNALRANLKAQVTRLLASEKSRALTENFVGQWLQSRDITLIGLNEREILAGDGQPNSRFRLDGGVRRAMQQETEMSFDYILHENRSLLELIDANYTFLNRDLAEHYGIEGVSSRRMQKFDLPEDSFRGGVLTQGTILGVTSNPTRTSPVKRGLFILENILGTPAPPAPPDVPELEEAQEAFEGDHVPNMRELMEIHREQKLCRSCHARMDPLGLALENFNAMGMWRDHQAGVDIDPSGTLITGESFQDIRDLKRILANDRRLDYYRIVSEKLMTYAIGRGLDYYDTHTIDTLVQELDRNEGRIMTLIHGIINSPAFQRTRPPENSSLARN